MKTLRLADVGIAGFYWLRVRDGFYPKPGPGPWEMCEFRPPHAGWMVDIIGREDSYEFAYGDEEGVVAKYLDEHEFVGPLPPPEVEK